MNTNPLVVVTAAVLILGSANDANATLIAHWGFDETSGTTAFDSVGSINGSLVSGAVFTGSGGILGGAISISNGYVDMGDHFAASSAFSVQAWVKTSPGDVSALIPVSKHWSTVPQGYALSVNDTTTTGSPVPGTTSFYSANGSYDTAVGGATNDGAWHQLIGVYENGTTYIYIDGLLADTGSAGFSDNTAHFMVGGLFDASGTPVNHYQGLVDEVAFFDTALSAIEVQNLYNNTISSVPIPSSLFLFAPALLGLVGTSIRKRSRIAS